MPSVSDIVRNITINSKATGVSETNAALGSLQDALGATADAAKSAFDSVSQAASGASGAAAAGGLFGIGGLALGVTAGTAALIGLLDVLKNANHEMADLGTGAKQAGLSLQDFQELKFTSALGGVGGADFAKGAATLAANLDAATRSDTEFSKLLDANNVKYADGNKLLLSQNQMWDTARDLISRAANEQQKIKIADMLGLSKEWIPVLDQSAASFAAQRAQAEQLGVVLSSDVVAKAKQFDDEWRASSVTLSGQVKSALAGLLPVMDDMIGKAKEFTAEAFNSPAAQAAAQNAKRAAEILSMAGHDASAEESAKLALLAARALVGAISDQNKALLDQQIITKDTAKMWEAVSAGWESSAAASKKMNDQLAAGAGGSAGAGSGNPTIIPSDKDRDAFDRYIDQLGKSNAAQQALVQTVGLAVGAHEQLKVQLQGVSILERDEIVDTDARREALAKLAQQAGATAQALALAQVNNKIGFDRGTLGLTDQDVKIATELKSLYGNDIPAAMASSQAAALRLNDNLKTGRDLASTFASGFLLDLSHGVSTMQALQNALTRLSDSLIKMISDKLVQQAFGGLLNGVGLSGLSGAPTGGGNQGEAVWVPPISAGTGRIGGMIGSLPTQFVHPAYYENAPRMRTGGMITDDGVPIIAHPGERVLNADETAAYNRGGGNVTNNVIIQNQSGAQATQSQKRNSSGGIDTTVMIRQAVVDTLAGGHADPAMQSRFGVKPSSRSR